MKPVAASVIMRGKNCTGFVSYERVIKIIGLLDIFALCLTVACEDTVQDGKGCRCLWGHRQHDDANN